MTKSFDEWWEENGELYRDPTSDERYLFESGQQSKQAEVDELRERIEEALTTLNNAYPESWGYCVEEAIKILKGNTNED